MKIKTKKVSYDYAVGHMHSLHIKPKRPNLLFRTLVHALAKADLKDADFSYTYDERAKAAIGPYLILMNHSSFIDLEIVSEIFYPMPYGIVCTTDGFVGKKELMRQIGCIPTNKFVSDLALIRDMKYMLKTLKTSVLMYPEASYSFDGCATPLPRALGSLFKMLGCPVLMVTTRGAFTRDPLYNGLRKRKVKVSAEVSLLFGTDEIESMTPSEMDARLDEAFSFDNFAWQRDNGIEVSEPFRAEGLERILYKCPSCLSEGETLGSGCELICRKCGKKWTLTELGQMRAENGDSEFEHIPDWYKWERDEVRREIDDGAYSLDTAVSIGMLVNYKSIYMIGDGRLVHGTDGFVLESDDGHLHYRQSPLASYSLYSDYYWYEIGDMICIGNRDSLFYCFPKEKCPVAKARLAAEEMYKTARRRVKK